MQQRHIASVSSIVSANGAFHPSLGHRPRKWFKSATKGLKKESCFSANGAFHPSLGHGPRKWFESAAKG
jgi:hypothetical protein